MSKIKLTKGELKRQRDALRQFQHYLPTLQLKKQQLQLKIREVMHEFGRREAALKVRLDSAARWVGLLGEAAVDMRPWVIPSKIAIDQVNIAGTSVPVFRNVEFAQADYDLYDMPLWVDRVLEELRAYVTILVELEVLREQERRLMRELRITNQRVNLFEKVKIPECQENIRLIRIYLGDQMANAVGISKVAKKKLELAGV